MVGGFASRDLERAVQLVPSERHHSVGEIDEGEDVPVGSRPIREQPLCLLNPVSSLVEATKTNEDHRLRGKGKDRSPRVANAFG